MEWKEIINRLEKELGLQDQRSGLAKLLGIRSGIISDIKSGKAKKPSSSIALMLINKLNVNPEWLEYGKEPVFIERLGNEPNDRNLIPVNRLGNEPTNIIAGIEELALKANEPHFDKLSERLDNIENRLNQLEKLQKQNGLPDEVKEPEAVYGVEVEKSDEPMVELPLAIGLAAGLPVEAFDVNETYQVPKKYLKESKRYCVAQIKGTSMTEAGIQDGDFVLLEYTNQAESGKIMVVKYDETTTLKRLHENNNGDWELLYEDGSRAKIELEDGQWDVQGEFVRVL